MDKQILVIEDEPQLAGLVEMHLEDVGYQIESVLTGSDGLDRSSRKRFDLIVLDLMLPDMDGLDVCRALRVRQDYTPILMLTARSSELDRVLGLELGADDYLTKPFNVRELVARVKAIFRRVERLSQERDAADPGPLEFEGLIIDQHKRQVTVRRQAVHLTTREFDLLVRFARSPGRVYTRAQLLDLVWGYGAGSYEHTVNSHINRLRAKIESDPSRPRFIQTVWGIGYRFYDPAFDDSRPRADQGHGGCSE